MWSRTLIAIVLIAATLGAGCLGGFLHPPVIPPAIVPVEGASLDRTPVYTFPFEDGEETIRVEPDPAVYAGAKEADRQLYLSEELAEEEWIPIYYRAFINDSCQEPFYADLLAALHHIRDREGLDDDRYLELITAFVQSIPYRTDTSIVEPKFPIETYVDGEGDCDDKALLLAGLLVREGYGVALLYFGDERHMAVGVKSDGCLYRDTPFAYIETTNTSYVGIPPAVLSDGTTLSTDPLVIPIGDGGGAYTACGDVGTIEQAITTSRDRAEEIAPELAGCMHDLEVQREALESLNEQLADLAEDGEFAEYNRLVPGYNQKAREYNDAVEAYNALIEESEAAVDLHNYIVTHAYDRPGSYLRARAYLAE
ncbi:hypothetical protein [Methanoculleus sp.]|uniref:hypothetical protein n=1 Tax=Methanoculleus sp. TaxID=90427 RepID=UPI0025DA5607|nr:hypothetical protein [Methanoculleus sp.]